MIDFHSHILPQIDDGSGSVEESRHLLETLAAQRVDLVAATSHFYAHQRTPEHFLERRQEAFEKLRPVLTDGMPRIRLGAEVLYFRGITRMKELPDLRLQGTKLLLLEMPFRTWSDGEVREVVDLCRDTDFVVLMAHIERYLKFQKNEVWDRLLAEGAMMQCNATFFLPLLSQRKAAKMIREGRVHVLGTDCHNMSSRPPRMDEAVQVLNKHLGRGETERFLDRAYDYLEEWSL